MKPATSGAVVFLAAISFAHMLRLVYAVDLTVGKFVVPMWLSALAVLVTGGLAVAVWREHRLDA